MDRHRKLKDAYYATLKLWTEIQNHLKNKNWQEAVNLLPSPCPLCDYFDSTGETCPLPNENVLSQGRWMPLCSCSPHIGVVRWRLGVLIEQAAKRSRAGREHEAEEFGQIAFNIIEASKFQMMTRKVLL